jgi:hypothetical protein
VVKYGFPWIPDVGLTGQTLKEAPMKWSEVRQAYPDQWLVIEALEAHTEDRQRFLDRIAVLETCSDGKSAMDCYRQLHQQHPLREFYYVHTSRAELEIFEGPGVSARRQHAASAGA